MGGGRFCLMEHAKPQRRIARFFFYVRILFSEPDVREFLEQEESIFGDRFKSIIREISPTGQSKLIYGRRKGETRLKILDDLIVSLRKNDFKSECSHLCLLDSGHHKTVRSLFNFRDEGVPHDRRVRDVGNLTGKPHWNWPNMPNRKICWRHPLEWQPSIH